MMGKTIQDYTAMQKGYYEAETVRMKVDNHKFHNNNPDYWNVLLKPISELGDLSDKVALDFGCGCGRNVINLLNKYDFKEVHGCDISSNNIEYSTQITPGETDGKINFKFVTVDGQSLQPLESNTYDFIMSTIVLQHICVYTIRKSILTDMFRCLKSGGVLSFQMGYGPGHRRTADYYEDAVHANETNSGYDVRVDSEDQIIKDLAEIGFTNITTKILPPYSDTHSNWIYVRAKKP